MKLDFNLVEVAQCILIAHVSIRSRKSVAPTWHKVGGSGRKRTYIENGLLPLRKPSSARHGGSWHWWATGHTCWEGYVLNAPRCIRGRSTARSFLLQRSAEDRCRAVRRSKSTVGTTRAMLDRGEDLVLGS